MEKFTNDKGYDAELYVDGASAYVYAIRDGEVVWGACHREELIQDAVEDLLALVDGHDPLAEGWEHGCAEGESDTAWADEVRYSCETEAPCMVASTYCYDGSTKTLLELNPNGYPVNERLAEVLLGPGWYEEF